METDFSPIAAPPSNMKNNTKNRGVPAARKAC
jgi:hypothetical protein